jgi:uncharacterized protein YnzC (UPF0291/DUF896 family)
MSDFDQVIKRINELARKKKQGGLSEAEQLEQTKLRKVYLDNFRSNFKQELDNIIVVQGDPDDFTEFDKQRAQEDSGKPDDEQGSN